MHICLFIDGLHCRGTSERLRLRRDAGEVQPAMKVGSDAGEPGASGLTEPARRYDEGRTQHQRTAARLIPHS
jgi:hypothetical protein